MTFASCELEVITRLERIQSFGFLLALAGDWRILRASANLEAFLGTSAQRAIGEQLDSLVDIEMLHDIRNRMIGLASIGGTERLYGMSLVKGMPPLDLAIHYAGSICIIEGERAVPDSRVDAASLVRSMVAKLGKKSVLPEFHRDAARQIQRLTGFSRVMIYRFGADGSGEVIAEEVKHGVESFLGLHYPASDIPAQARALYLLNSFRVIADVQSVTIPVIAAPEDQAAALDLSLSITRAVAPVHIEYLRNMQVGASLSVSILVDGALWGLIACHHPESRLPSFVIRSAVELFGQMYSMMLETRLRHAQDHEDRQTRESCLRVLASLVANADLLSHAGWLLDQLRPLVGCDGVAVCLEGRLSLSGSTPSRAEVEEVVNLMRRTPIDEVFATDYLSGLRAESSAYCDEAAGCLGFALSPTYRDYIVLFRRERIQEVRWAGRPEKLIDTTQATQSLSPRTSFAAFAQSISGHSRSFTAGELRAAESLRTGLNELTLHGPRSVDTERQRNTERQELLIAELNHRVRNILALIRGLITQTNGEGGDATNYVASLNGRVQALARAHDRVTRHNWGPAPLRAIFEDEIAAYVPTQHHRFTIEGAPVLLHPPAFSAVALIIHELVTNCAKYGSLSANGRVEVTLKHVIGAGLVLKWRESGGPLVRVPTRRGFGSVIIERVVPFDLQGSADVQYLPAGLEAAFVIPERYIAPSIDVNPDTTGAALIDLPARIAPRLSRPLKGLLVLLVEDNLIVALESEDMLRELGARLVMTVSTIAGAAALLEEEPFDFAVLDINLGGESSLEFAARIHAKEIPFIFASGYGDHGNLGRLNHAVLAVSKPYDQDDLRFAVTQTLQRDAKLPRLVKSYEV